VNVMLLIYQGLCAFIALLVASVVLRTRTRSLQIIGAIVLVPLLLRLFLVK
jgi:hypothetical protein